MNETPSSNAANNPTKPIRTRWVILIILLLLLLPVVALYIHAFWYKPNPTVDYLAMINAKAMAVPEEDRAWPLYRELIIKYDLNNLKSLPGWGPKRNPHYIPPTSKASTTQPASTPPEDEASAYSWHEQSDTSVEFLDYDDMIPPGDPRWPQAVASLKPYDGLFEDIRRAASQKGMGLVIRHQYTGLDALAIGPQASMSDLPLWEDSLLTLYLPMLGQSRQMARLLITDARRASHEQDFARVDANLSAMIGLADHISEPGLTMNTLVAYSILSMLYSEVSYFTSAQGPHLTDEQYAALERILDQTDQCLYYTSPNESYYYLDILQRIYGPNGRITYSGINQAQTLVGYPIDHIVRWPLPEQQKAALTRILMPWLTATTATHKEVLKAGNEYLTHATAIKPSHHYHDYALEKTYWRDLKNQYQNVSRLGNNPYWILTNLWDFSTPGVAYRVHLANSVKRQGLRVGLAMERYRRDTGQYPSSLDELVPRYLPEVPQDPAVKAPIRYKLVQGKPLLYSIGLDGDDDHAATTIQIGRDDDGDWILYPIPE